MLFNSREFAWFFAVFFPLYWLLPHRARTVLLLAGGYFFYACWDWRFLSLLIISTLMDFVCGLAVDRTQQPAARKTVVALSMTLNLGFLGFFKYANFFAGSLKVLLARWGLDVPLGQLGVVLPIGISFYTFQSMSYVIDVYRRDIRATRNFIDFAAFVSFFPHLVAGPIMRPTTLLPQIQTPRRFNLAQFYEGAYLIFWGLTKKVVIADNLAKHVVDPLFARWATLDGGQAVLAVYAFAFQIYCDFSGYTDAARGVAKCLGFELALNFNLPYFAISPKDFWSRWHISLSTWLRDYVYIPLGGSRGNGTLRIGNIMLAVAMAGLGLGLGLYALDQPRVATLDARLPWLKWVALTALLVGCVRVMGVRSTTAQTSRNLMLTMVIGGLWHGAAWTFVIWGFYHGALLVIHRRLEPWLTQYRPSDAVEAACWKGVRIFTTFQLVSVGWLFFRARSLDQALGMLRAIVLRPAIPPAVVLVPFLICVVPLLLMQYAQYRSRNLSLITRTPWYVRSLFYTIMFYAFVLYGEFGGSQFIYFQF